MTTLAHLFRRLDRLACGFLALCAAGMLSTADAQDFTVTTPGSFYSINGDSPNPTLKLTRGQTYTFSIQADASHPFEIVSDNATGTPYNNGVLNNNIAFGTLTFTVPTDAPGTLYYICSLHFFFGVIQVVDPEAPADFTVTTPEFFYSINNLAPNPDLTLTRGVTYTFAVHAASDHPFQIVSDATTGASYDDGVLNNNIAEGRMTFTVPMSAPDELYYICSLHFFGGAIHIVDPAPVVPVVRIISIALTTSNVTMASTGTNGWKAVPEFSSNWTTRVWLPVPGFTNSFSNGTNFTRFGRLEAICGPNVFLRINNTTN